MLAAILIIASLGDPLELTVTSQLGELDDAVRGQVTSRVEAVASALDHQRAQDAEHKLTIHLEWAQGSQTDFHVTLRSSLGEDLAQAQTQSFDCRECNAAELLDRTEARARTAIEQLFESAADQPQDVATPTPTAPPPQPPPSPPAPREKLGALGWVGVGSLGLGVSGLTAGGVFLALGETRVKSDPTSLRDFRPAGYVALGLGGAALITGTVLLVLDRARARARAGSTALRVTPGGSGLRIRF